MMKKIVTFGEILLRWSKDDYQRLMQGRKFNGNYGGSEANVAVSLAMLGDRVEVGCNSVLNPGTVVGRDSNIYPVSCVRGVIPPCSICKTGGIIVDKISE